MASHSVLPLWRTRLGWALPCRLSGAGWERWLGQSRDALVVHPNPCWSARDLPGFACGPEHSRSLTQRSEQTSVGLCHF